MGSPKTRRAVSGAPGGAYCPTREFGPLLREVFTPRPSPPSTIQGLSWQGNTALLLPIVALCGIIAGNTCFVKGNSDQKSTGPSRAGDDLSGTYDSQSLMGNGGKLSKALGKVQEVNGLLLWFQFTG